MQLASTVSNKPGTVTAIHNITCNPKLSRCLASLLWSRHGATADTRCLAAAWHLKPPWQHILTPLSPPSPLILLSLLPSPHHQGDLNPASPRPWHSRLPLPAPGTVTTCQPPDSTHGGWMSRWALCVNHGWLASRLTIALASYINSDINLSQLAWDEMNGTMKNSLKMNLYSQQALAWTWILMSKLIQARISIQES